MEGLEINVLKVGTGIIGRDRPKIIIETHRGNTKLAVIKLLGTYGYKLVHSNSKHLVFRIPGFDFVENLFFSQR